MYTCVGLCIHMHMCMYIYMYIYMPRSMWPVSVLSLMCPPLPPRTERCSMSKCQKKRTYRSRDEDIWNANIRTKTNINEQRQSLTRQTRHSLTCVCCSVWQCLAMCCSLLQCVAAGCSVLQCVAVCCGVLQCAAVCFSVLQCAAGCCSVLRCVAVCCSVVSSLICPLLLWRARCNMSAYQKKGTRR